MENKTVLSVKYPTPLWLRKIVRVLTWIAAIWGGAQLFVDFRDFGVSEATAFLILKYASGAAGLISGIARFVGEKPVYFNDENE